MTVAALPLAAEAAGGAEAGAVATRAGAGKVVDAKVVSSKPLKGRNTRSVDRGRDAAAGAGVSSMMPKSWGSLGGKKSAPTSPARKLLVAEFAICMVVLAFTPLTGKVSGAAFMKRASAIMGLFFLLGLVATAGRGAARAATGLGGLVTLVLLISDRSIFTNLTAKFAPGVGEEDSDLGGLDAQDLLDDESPDTEPLPPKGPLGNGIR